MGSLLIPRGAQERVQVTGELLAPTLFDAEKAFDPSDKEGARDLKTFAPGNNFAGAYTSRRGGDGGSSRTTAGTGTLEDDIDEIADVVDTIED